MHPSPVDPSDRHWQEQTHPSNWKNSRPKPSRYDLVVIGGGTAGLVSAVGAAGLGARVALLERSFLGGDCLGTGCVPSKALLRSAKALIEIQSSSQLGILVTAATADFAEIMARMRRLRSELSHHDSAQRMASLGIDLYFGDARFSSPRSVQIGGETLPFKRCILATGARPAVPSVDGLNQIPFLTSDTIFQLTQLPKHLAILGGGPIGCELAQVFRALGAEVTILSRGSRLLEKEPPAAASILQTILQSQGIQILTGVSIASVKQTENDSLQIHLQGEESPSLLSASHLLTATGRKSNVEGLALDTANVDATNGSIRVNKFLQTTNPAIYAAGDCIGGPQFTHAADAMARTCIQNAFFSWGWLGKKAFPWDHVPRTTYTQPEIASIGLTVNMAQKRGIAIDSFTYQLQDLDRAKLDDAGAGFAEIHCKKGTSQIIGGTIVSPHAGELMGELGLAFQKKIPLSALSSTIHCYPTEAEILKRIGDQFNRTRLTPFVANLLRTIIQWRS